MPSRLGAAVSGCRVLCPERRAAVSDGEAGRWHGRRRAAVLGHEAEGQAREGRGACVGRCSRHEHDRVRLDVEDGVVPRPDGQADDDACLLAGGDLPLLHQAGDIELKRHRRPTLRSRQRELDASRAEAALVQVLDPVEHRLRDDQRGSARVQDAVGRGPGRRGALDARPGMLGHGERDLSYRDVVPTHLPQGRAPNQGSLGVVRVRCGGLPEVECALRLPGLA
mmetsp:Transcript_21558/g.64775  ORF Transcript_21558/g.64775 Transcript_21558/m.64775 type:complete len:224 (+) Transcript_21558:166-837(+)